MVVRVSLMIGLVILSSAGFSQKRATIKEYKKTFPTYGYSDPDPVPDFSKIYPYFRFDGFTDKSQPKEWKVVELENDYIRVMILPEIGGKIWAAIEKSTNQPFIYYNHSVKFRDVAMRGPWTSGGIEANYGIIGHTPNSASPVDYLMKEKEDGSVSCFIAWLDLLTRTNWCVEINLPVDKAYFSTHSTWYNNTEMDQPYYHWMNVGIKTKGNLQFIYPGTKYIGHEGEYADWPVNKTNGKHIDSYNENNFGGYKSYHVFGKYTDFFGAYWHDDDFGMARYSLHEEKAGKKIWIWGLSQQGMIWEKLLTDTDGQYAEIQSGRLFNQSAERSSLTPFKHISFEPYATDTWTEFWYPVLHTKGFVKANEYGALNVRFENGWLKINFSPTQPIDDSLRISDGDHILYRKTLQLSPLKAFADSMKMTTLPAALTVTIGHNKIKYVDAPGQDELSRPVDAPADFNWNNAYGNYIAGEELMDQRLYSKAKEKLQQSLKLDSNFLPSLSKMAELYYHNMEYAKALSLVKRALSIDTYDGAANYYYGLINAQTGNLTDAKDGFDVAALLPAYRAAAYTALSKLYIREKNYDKADLYASKALTYNTSNITAYKLKAILYRKLGNRGESAKVIMEIEKLDPLNHFTSFEKWLWSNDQRDKQKFTGEIQNELVYQTFLELSMDYYNLGCLDEALQLLEMAPAHALVSYWRAFIQYNTGKAPDLLVKEGDNSSAAFVLPFRSESEAMLKWIITQTGSWKPKYYLALLYRDRDRTEECYRLLSDIGDLPSESFFYATRSAEQKVDSLLEKDLVRAHQLDKNEWRYVRKLAGFYLSHQDYVRALAITEPFYKAHSGNYIIGMSYAKCLLAGKRYADAARLLRSIQIIPFEGATDGRELYRQTMLTQGVQSIKSKKFSGALDFLSKARQFPENLGSGKPYEEDIDYRVEDFLTAVCYEKTNKKEQAGNLYRKVAAYSKPGPRLNMIVQAWAMQKLNDKEAADRLADKILSAEKDESLKTWTMALLSHGSIMERTQNIDDNGMLLLESIKELTR